jgi:hypothetical protein
MEYIWNSLVNGPGYLTAKIPDHYLKHLAKEVNSIKSQFNLYPEYNDSLAGNINREYSIESEEVRGSLKTVLHSLLDSYNHVFPEYLKEIERAFPVEYCQIVLNDLWVNFQTKHEFNPIHNHNGVYSFVIWLDIPYNIQDEIANGPGAKSNASLAGHFQFVSTNALGMITTHNLPVDKTWNNTICIFPSSLHHTVMPFFTSDEYRITVSGNLGYNIHQERK